MESQHQPKLPISTPFLQQRLLRLRSHENEVLFLLLLLLLLLLSLFLLLLKLLLFLSRSILKVEDGEEQPLLSGSHQVFCKLLAC